MDELKTFYRRALPARIEALETALGVLQQDAAAAASIRRIAHSLRGSGGTYGFPEISARAEAVEAATAAELPQRTAALIELLRSTADGAS